MNKRYKSLAVIYAIAYAVFCALFFAIPFNRTANAWICFAFTTVSFVVGCVVTFRAFRNRGLKSKIYGFPIFRIGLSYTIVQTVFTFILLCVELKTAAPTWVSVAVSALLLGAAGIGVISTSTARDIIEEQEAAQQAATKPVKQFRIDLESIVAKCGDPEVKKVLQKLSDDFRYSDPVSIDELSEIEEKIRVEVKVLDNLVQTEPEAAPQKAEEIALLLADRNRRSKALK